MNFSQILNYNLLSNSVLNFLYVVCSIILLSIAFKILLIILNKTFVRLAEKTETNYDDVIIDIFRGIKPHFYIYLAFYFSVLTFLNISSQINTVLRTILLVWIVYYFIVAGQKIILFLTKKLLVKDEGDTDAKTAAGAIGILTKIILWSTGLLLILSNLGFNITSLIAGLGIGGVAIAFALQNILSDLFSSFAIYFDKPFRVGDVILVDNIIGVVEKIGIKTTRIKALQGEEVVMSNNKLTSATIQNFKKLKERRVVFNIGVTYSTNSKKLRSIPEIIKKIVDGTESIRFDRSHFKSMGDSALIFETVYYAETDDYAKYMDANQQVLLALKDIFDKEKIDFAFPTQTIYLEK